MKHGSKPAAWELIALKRRKVPQSQSFLDAFKEPIKVVDIALFVSKLSTTKLKIIQLLGDGYYPAAIARRLDLSRSYVSRFVKDLYVVKGLISVEYVNPLTRRATSYRVSDELKNHLNKLPSTKTGEYTLAIPHKIRYNYPLEGKTKPFSLNTKRFAASKLKHTKTWCMRGGSRHVFETTHPHIGKVGIILHPKSMEVYQRDRHQIIAASPEEATNIVAMALNEIAQRFVQEQAWESVHMELGQPRLVSSPHYAFASTMAKRVVDAGQSMLKVGNGLEIDNSLSAQGITHLAEIETMDIDEATTVDIGLRNAANIHNIIPDMLTPILQREISSAMIPLRSDFENLTAHVNAGNTLQYQFNQMAGMLASTLKTMHQLQDEVTALKTKQTASDIPKLHVYNAC